MRMSAINATSCLFTKFRKQVVCIQTSDSNSQSFILALLDFLIYQDSPWFRTTWWFLRHQCRTFSRTTVLVNRATSSLLAYCHTTRPSMQSSISPTQPTFPSSTYRFTFPFVPNIKWWFAIRGDTIVAGATRSAVFDQDFRFLMLATLKWRSAFSMTEFRCSSMNSTHLTTCTDRHFRLSTCCRFTAMCLSAQFNMTSSKIELSARISIFFHYWQM